MPLPRQPAPSPYHSDLESKLVSPLVEELHIIVLSVNAAHCCDR